MKARRGLVAIGTAERSHVPALEPALLEVVQHAWPCRHALAQHATLVVVAHYLPYQGMGDLVAKDGRQV